MSAEPVAEPVARQRILDSAYDLFSRRGVRAVGIEEVIERAAVAKATLYRHFPSKDHLVLEFLRQRETIWTHGWVEAEARKRGAAPDDQLLAIFDLFDEWFHRADFEGCSFINILLETANREHPVGRASADHLLGLIDEILTFSRVEAGKEVVRLEDEDLRALVEETVTMVRPLAEHKGLTLVAEYPEGSLRTDGGKLRQILLNLLSNAVKFTDKGEVTLRGRRDENGAEFYISDTGIGIAPENLQRIFEPFWQVEQSSTRRAGGTGLGLTVSRSLARLLGGDVSVESTPGVGSTFTVTLPAQDVESRPA